jgi:predicted MPP superfamily phosphohydrolase
VVLFAAFFAVVIGVFTLMQWRLLRAYRHWVRAAIDGTKHKRWLVSGNTVLVLFNLMFVLRFILGEMGAYDHPLSQALIMYPSGIYFASVAFGFLLISLLDVVSLASFAARVPLRWIRRAFVKARPSATRDSSFHPGRRQFLRLSGASAIAVIGGAPLLGAVTTARDYQLNRVPLMFPDLPSEFEGFTIAQISDIHSGVFMTEQNMREIFELANGLFPNLTVITGDLVDNADSQISSLYRAIEPLKSDNGVYGCLGNHDHYATADKVVAAMEQRDITMLNNAHRTLTIDGVHLSLIGIDDAGKGGRNYARLDEALLGVDPESLKILLSHRPDVFPEAKANGVDLMLSGHTHGGQIGFEILGVDFNPVYLIHKYARGLYQEQGKYVYVNVGVGMVGAPIRLVRPEISLFTLHRGNSAAHASSTRSS